MAYGSGANWAGTDQSDNDATVDWSTNSSASAAKLAEGEGQARFTIEKRSTPEKVAEAMATAWNAVPENEKVTQNGATVRWPAGTNITDMHFTVNNGAQTEVPGRGDPVGVFDGLTVKNIA